MHCQLNVSIHVQQSYSAEIPGEEEQTLSLSQLMLSDSSASSDQSSATDIPSTGILTRWQLQRRCSPSMPSSPAMSGNQINSSNIVLVPGPMASAADLNTGIQRVRDETNTSIAALRQQFQDIAEASQGKHDTLITRMTAADALLRQEFDKMRALQEQQMKGFQAMFNQFATTAAEQSSSIAAMQSAITAAAAAQSPPPVLPSGQRQPQYQSPAPAARPPPPVNEPAAPLHLINSLGVDAAAQAQINQLLGLAGNPALDVQQHIHLPAPAPSTVANAIMTNDPFASMTGSLASLAPVGDDAPSLEHYTNAILTARRDHRPFKTVEDLEQALTKLRRTVMSSPTQTDDSKMAIASYVQHVIGYAHATNVVQATLYHRAVLLARDDGLFQLTKLTDIYYPAYHKHIATWLTDKKIAEVHRARPAHDSKGKQYKRGNVVTFPGASSASAAAASSDSTGSLHCEHHPWASSHSTTDCRTKKRKL